MQVGSIVFGQGPVKRDSVAGVVTSRQPQPAQRLYRRPDGIPSRCDISLMSDAELAITAAMHAVEAAGGSVALTDAITLLSKARDRVADHVEAVK